MPVNFRQYGIVQEFIEYERRPSGIRVPRTWKRPLIVGARRPDSIRRTRTICVRRLFSALEEYGCPLLVSLTFAANNATDAFFAGSALRDFLLRLRAYFKGVHAIFAPELSPRGRVHFHGLVFNVPLSYGDTKKGRRVIAYGEEREKRTFAGLWRQGWVDCVKTDGSPKLAYYLSKYITKAGGEVFFNGMRLLRMTKGFPKELYIQDAELLFPYFSDRTPVSVWEDDNYYLGHVKRTRYLLEPQKNNAAFLKAENDIMEV